MSILDGWWIENIKESKPAAHMNGSLAEEMTRGDEEVILGAAGIINGVKIGSIAAFYRIYFCANPK